MVAINLSIEKAWITFQEGWENVWYPVTDENGNHLYWDSKIIMSICRKRFNGITFGIAPTSQMIIRNAVRDNF